MLAVHFYGSIPGMMIDLKGSRTALRRLISVTTIAAVADGRLEQGAECPRIREQPAPAAIQL
jgi:hypothetical protein